MKNNKELMKELEMLIENGSDISGLDVSKIKNMCGMFFDAYDSNQNISKWNVGNVTNMYGMFRNARVFNQDIGLWNVSNVTNMSEMFVDAKSFNQDISKWDVRNVKDMSNMFKGATAFIKGKYFEKTLKAWAEQRGVSVESLKEEVNESIKNVNLYW